MNKTNLQNFVSRIKSNGMPTASKFFVFVPNLGSAGLMMMCDATSIPGQNIMTSDIRQFGELTEMPYGIVYPAVPMSFYLDNTMEIKHALDGWLKEVYDKDSRSVGYYTNYTKQVDIFLTNAAGKVIYCTRLNECYPKAIGDIRLDYSSANTIIKVDVQLVYKWWDAMEFNSTGEAIGTLANRIDAQAGSTSFLSDYTNNNPKVQNIFGVVPEGQSTITGVTKSGTVDVNNMTLAKDFNINYKNNMNGFGTDTQNVFSKMGNGGAAAFNSSTMDSSFASQMAYGFSSISKDMQDYGTGIIGLGRDIISYTQPLSQIAGSVGAISGTLNTIDNAFNTFGLGKPFSKVSGQLASASGKLGTIASMKGIPGQLSNVGSIMNSTGAVFNSTIDTLKNVPGYTAQVQKYITGMGEAFNKTGTNTMNASATIESKINYEEYLA